VQLKKPVWAENAVRCALVCAVVWGIGQSTSRAYQFGPTPLTKNDKFATQPEAAAGMGGYSYPAAYEAGSEEAEEFLRAPMLLFSAYTIQPGDMIGILAQNWGLNQDTLISVNKIKNTRGIRGGQVIRVPNQDGILYEVKKGDTVVSIAEKYEANPGDLVRANELFSWNVKPGSFVFVPGAKLDWVDLQERNGDLFLWPVPSHVITSSFGYRSDPVGQKSKRTYHTGMDIRAAFGTRVNAAMSGRVTKTAYNDVYGNYVIIAHHSGYVTLYGHLSRITVQAGKYVNMGQKVAESGSTGMSTGPHLHFTVWKHGALVNPRLLMN
jgi:murein DD-endopeptidase MepM/ murein hydrolase activator NlpD